MTTGDEQASGTVDNFIDPANDAVGASNERYQLLSQVATLRAEVSRQAEAVSYTHLTLPTICSV